MVDMMPDRSCIAHTSRGCSAEAHIASHRADANGLYKPLFWRGFSVRVAGFAANPSNEVQIRWDRGPSGRALHRTERADLHNLD
jgi:hypothetical protein